MGHSLESLSAPSAGYVNVDAYEETLQAFSHWTFQATDGRLMVVDIQVGSCTVTTMGGPPRKLCL